MYSTGLLSSGKYSTFFDYKKVKNNFISLLLKALNSWDQALKGEF